MMHALIVAVAVGKKVCLGMTQLKKVSSLIGIVELCLAEGIKLNEIFEDLFELVYACQAVAKKI